MNDARTVEMKRTRFRGVCGISARLRAEMALPLSFFLIFTALFKSETACVTEVPVAVLESTTESITLTTASLVQSKIESR
jgi:hypothetical protein